MYHNVKPVMPLMFAWEIMPKPGMVDTGAKTGWKRSWEKINKIAQRNTWQLDMREIKNALKKDNYTVVVTEADQTILYVNSNFEKMTGYASSEAIGKKPNFLQGPKTDPVVRRKINQAIKETRSVEAEVFNYRKDGGLYLCSIEIIPVFNAQEELVNFVALEQELPLVAESV